MEGGDHAQSEIQIAESTWGRAGRQTQASQANTPYKGLRRSVPEEFVFLPVPVENLGMTWVFTGFQNWEEFRSQYFISIKENFLSDVILANWEIQSSIERGFFFF